jgi:hypothetical protein
MISMMRWIAGICLFSGEGTRKHMITPALLHFIFLRFSIIYIYMYTLLDIIYYYVRRACCGSDV